MRKQKKWNVYILSKHDKLYLCKGMTAQEVLKWLESNCKIENSDYYMCGNQVFYECK